MDFEEWFESRDDIGCLIGLEGYAAKEAWNARQAEIDALQEKINEALAEISRAMKCCESIETDCVLTEIKELLK